MVCVEWERRGLFYSLERLVPTISSYENVLNRHLEDHIKLPAKMHLDGNQVRFGQTHGLAGPTLAPLATTFLRVSAWWALMSVRRCWGWSGLWASFACVTQDAIFCHFVCVFFVFSSYSGLVLLKT